MSPAFLPAILVSAILLRALAAQPDWVRGLGKSDEFPESKFFIGFGASASREDIAAGERILQAKNSAKSALVESMRVRVVVKRTDGTIVSSSSAGRLESRSDYWSQVVSTSDLDIQGIEFEIYREDAGRTVYALAWIDKEKGRWNYRRLLASRFETIALLEKRGMEFVRLGDVIAASELDNEASATVEEIDRLSGLLELFGGSQPVSAMTDAKARAERLHRMLSECRPDSECATDSLRVSLWIRGGVTELAAGTGVAVFVHVNKPCYLHLVCRLSNGRLILFGEKYWNFRIGREMVNVDVVLPDSFVSAYPFGVDTMEAFATEEPWSSCMSIPKMFGGEEYRVVLGNCIPLSESAGAFRRIAITTVAGAKAHSGNDFHFRENRSYYP